MYKALATFDGVLIALMVAFNGLLASHIGNEQSLMVIHFIGLLGTIILLLGSRNRLQSLNGLPAYLFIAGALGIFNVLFNNLSFSALGATLTLSLNLIGQLITSMLIDHFGLLGLISNRINRTKLIGISIMVLGIISMMII
ncbi:DMT family transporter [Wukongibacter baidiensis]|uniref:DMT family transporter n=1 Tax=Wukongibacter baidiensis TaxID=1723361 RepID=UPI003D7FD458